MTTIRPSEAPSEPPTLKWVRLPDGPATLEWARGEADKLIRARQDISGEEEQDILDVDLGHLLAAWMGMGKPGKGGLPPGECDEFEQYLQQYWTERELNLAYLSAFGRALAFSEARSLARRMS